MIDDRAIIDSSAKIAANVTVGPNSFIGPNVEIGEGTWIGPNAVIKGPTKIGKNNKIFQFSSIGDDAQDLKYHGEENCRLEIGDDNIFREFCTINRGTAQDRGVTTIGSNNTFLAYTHVAHDCLVGNHVIFSNMATLAGHVDVGDYVIMSGLTAVHQFCHIGAHSFVSGGVLLKHDVPPYIIVAGATDEPKPFGLNSVGLQRRGFSKETMTWLKRAYKVIYRQNLTLQEAIEKLKEMTADCIEIQAFVEFLEHSEHGIVR
jgi:UDP-N-acetylglucosamine acyltransferase